MVTRRLTWKSYQRIAAALTLIATPSVAAGRKSAEPQGAPRIVVFDVTALDPRGEPVTDLTAADLQVFDSGKRQEVVFFRPNHPKTVSNADLSRDEFSNRAHPVPAATVILLDLMNERTRADAVTQNELVNALKGQESGTGLYLYILTNNGKLIPVHSLPNPEDDAAADEHWTAQIHPLLDPVINQIFGLRPLEDRDIGYRFQTTLQSVSALGSQIALVPGRKSLVWVTHGVPITVPDISGEPLDLSPEIHRFATSLEKAHIAAYPVDQSSKGAGADLNSFSTQTLEDISSLTGGRNYRSDSVELAINQARMDSRSSYAVGYIAPPQQQDGKFHKIRVSSPRHGLRLNAERGYYAYPDADSGDQDTLANAARSPFESPEIGLRAKARDSAGSKHLDIQIDPADLMFRPLGDDFQIDLLLLVFESSGQPPVNPEGFATRPQPPTPLPIHLSMTQEEHAKAVREGTGIERDIALADKTGQVRLVVVDQNSRRYGSLRIPVLP